MDEKPSEPVSNSPPVKRSPKPVREEEISEETFPNGMKKRITLYFDPDNLHLNIGSHLVITPRCLPGPQNALCPCDQGICHV